MTAADLIRVLLELDQQYVSPRPSSWGRAAELVHRLAAYYEGNEADSPEAQRLLGDWRSIDLSQVRGKAPRELSQPTVDLIREVERLKTENESLRKTLDARTAGLEKKGDLARWQAEGLDALSVRILGLQEEVVRLRSLVGRLAGEVRLTVMIRVSRLGACAATSRSATSAELISRRRVTSLRIFTGPIARTSRPG